MQDYRAAIEGVYSDYNVQSPLDFLTNIPDVVYAWDTTTLSFVSQEAENGDGITFFLPSDPELAPDTNDVAVRIAYIDITQLAEPQSTVDAAGVVVEEDPNFFETHFPTAVGIQVLHGTTPLIALELDVSYDPDTIMPMVGTATVFLDPYHMQVNFAVDSIDDTEKLQIDFALDIR